MEVRGIMKDLIEGVRCTAPCLPHCSPLALSLLPSVYSRYFSRGCLILDLHSRGIIHRDLKLSNILLDKNLRIVPPLIPTLWDTWHPNIKKIADFGLARIIEDSNSDEEYTFCGTPNYISPEILAHEVYGLESDIWSLGCIFLSLLSGTPPFAVLPLFPCPRVIENVENVEVMVGSGCRRCPPKGDEGKVYYATTCFERCEGFGVEDVRDGMEGSGD